MSWINFLFCIPRLNSLLFELTYYVFTFKCSRMLSTQSQCRRFMKPEGSEISSVITVAECSGAGYRVHRLSWASSHETDPAKWCC